MDGFDNNNMNDGRFKKTWMALIYVIAAIIVFAGGAFAYRYYTESITSSSKQSNDQIQEGTETSQLEALNEITTPTPSDKLQTALPTPTGKTVGVMGTNSPKPDLVSPTPQDSAKPNISSSAPQSTTKPNVSTPTPKATQKPKLTQRQLILDEMHKMANTKVVADHIWGEIPITTEAVDNLMAQVTASDFADKEKLIGILNKWMNADFSEAVKDHNYVWEQLGGTVGKATALKEN